MNRTGLVYHLALYASSMLDFDFPIAFSTKKNWKPWKNQKRRGRKV